MHNGTRFGRTAQGYGFFDVISSWCTRCRWYLSFGGDDDAIYTTEIKRSSRERDQKAVVHILHFIAIDFVLMLVTCLQNIVLLFHKQCILFRPLQASGKILLSAAQISIAFSLLMYCSPRT